jgi:CHASE2 domain-containing sensor protein
MRRTGMAIADALLEVALLLVAVSALTQGRWLPAVSAAALALLWGAVAWWRFTRHGRRAHAPAERPAVTG